MGHQETHQDSHHGENKVALPVERMKRRKVEQKKTESRRDLMRARKDSPKTANKVQRYLAPLSFEVKPKLLQRNQKVTWGDHEGMD